MSLFYQDSLMVLFDSNTTSKSSQEWIILNDGVMGGVSSADIEFNSDGNLKFSGTVRLENNGGFSSIQNRFTTTKVSSFSAVILKVKGDGKDYQFRVKSDLDQRFSYIQKFSTNGEWQTITLPFDQFYPVFRGYRLNQPNYDGKQMEQIAILIGNKKKENFVLEISKIYLK